MQQELPACDRVSESALGRDWREAAAIAFFALDNFIAKRIYFFPIATPHSFYSETTYFLQIASPQSHTLPTCKNAVHI